MHTYLTQTSSSSPNYQRRVCPGYPWPMGTYFHDGGANFTLFSRHAERVWLEFYTARDSAVPDERFELDPDRHRTGDIWHVWVERVSSGQFYGFRAAGPYKPAAGHRFNPKLLLLDPLARLLATPKHWDFHKNLGYDPGSPLNDLAPAPHDDAAGMARSIALPHRANRASAPFPHHPWSKTIIYETHVRGLTIHPSSHVAHPGTYQGIIEKLPYLQELGITAIELMPIFEFNAHENQRINPLTGEPLKNYWGYNPVAWFAPKAGYASDQTSPGPVAEFRDFIETCHQAGIEVILDVVYNHTAEGDETGPTLSFRGIDNCIYYLLDDDPSRYRNYTGTGNTINANHPVVHELIIESLHYWVGEMRIDGFRFDLASVLSRDEQGNLLPNTPILERIAEDPLLRDTKIIAEAWDAAGAYQVGRFAETRWAEWNGRYRDDVRCFWRGDIGFRGQFASRICGSSDLYRHSGKGPENSINFITCHDGFTLNDLVSYAHKHNEINGEDNRDGSDENSSANYGIEGSTEDLAIEAIRVRQIKNLLLTLMISRGVPMLLGGDEFCRTQQGNNNAYCQDNEISWYDWSLIECNTGIHGFTQALITFRKTHPVLSLPRWYTDEDIHFFAANGYPPNWGDPQDCSLGVLIFGQLIQNDDLYLLFNPTSQAIDFTLPAPPLGGVWHLVADTSRSHPDDFYSPGQEPALANNRMIRLGERSSIILRAIRV